MDCAGVVYCPVHSPYRAREWLFPDCVFPGIVSFKSASWFPVSSGKLARHPAYEKDTYDDDTAELPTRDATEYRPFIRRVPEFKFWYSFVLSIHGIGRTVFRP